MKPSLAGGQGADRDVTVLLAEPIRRPKAFAARIFAEAYGKDARLLQLLVS